MMPPLDENSTVGYDGGGSNEEGNEMGTILMISIIVVIVILVLSVAAISKGYSYKHTIDPPDEQREEHSDETKGKNPGQ